MEVFKTVGLATGAALEMHVVMMVIMLGAAFPTQGIAGTFVVDHLMYYSFFQESFQCSVGRHTVEAFAQPTLQVSVRKCHFTVYKSFQHLFVARGSTEHTIFECGGNGLFYRLLYEN
jgi:hypothetical protein